VVGLTLVELLMAVVVLSGASVLILQALASAAYGLHVADNRLAVYDFSVSKIAQLQLDAQAGKDLKEKSRGTFLVGADRFKWSVTALPIPEIPELRSVRLTVAWGEGSHLTESQFHTLVRVPEEAL